MPSVRFSRDKRGYEYVYLVHTPVKRGKPGRTRVLYWYRTPPGVRVGRKPFDDDVQRTLERQYPDLSFNWDAIIGTPMPPPDMTEFWRERRRMEKAARQERRADQALDDTAAAPADVTDGTAPDVHLESVSPDVQAGGDRRADAAEQPPGGESGDSGGDSAEPDGESPQVTASGRPGSSPSSRRRRRRPRPSGPGGGGQSGGSGGPG